MNYQEAWTFLNDLQFFKIKLGLDSMTTFLGELGDPQQGLKYVQVAGTNGKGSVAATLLTLLARAGYRVGLYTSPHLSSVRERFRINHEYISEQEFAEEATRIHAILQGRQITYFEFTTALALLWFARRQVDLVILEVGLGGRLDATNVITPEVGVITNVSMDHEAYLGNTLAEVAFEKAGIIKPGIPLVCGAAERPGADPVVLEVIARTCRERQAPLYLAERDFAAVSEEDGTWTYWGMERSGCCKVRKTVPQLVCGLPGEYQPANAALALAVLELLTPAGFAVGDAHIRQGLLEVKWPGRLEAFCVAASTGRPVDCQAPDRRRLLLDGAHNPAGVASLRKSLAHDFDYAKLILVWGAMADKKNTETLPLVAPLAERIILVRPAGERSAEPEALYGLMPAAVQEKCLCVGPVAAGLAQALALAGPDDLICVAGSLYLVGEVRSSLLGEIV